MIVRHQGWESLLAAWVDSNTRRAFEWGQFDCALMAADAVQAMTGHDFGAEWRGRYTTAKGARKALHRRGCTDVAAAVTRALGSPMANPLMAQRGDLLLFDVQGIGPTVGVCLGDVAAVPGPNGLAYVQPTAASMAWKV